MSNSSAALSRRARTRLAKLGRADIVVGVPSFNSAESIRHVVHTLSLGLARHYPDSRAVLLVVDGGSRDATVEQAVDDALAEGQVEIVTDYPGIRGKGSALRSLFAAADLLDVRACACVDADLRSITPDWVRFLLEPLLTGGYEFVAPLYSRYKYDGTITNNLVYPLTRALYGKRIRQPIGGDFGFSPRLARHYLAQPVWSTDVARFGIDIWMTLEAIGAGARVCQANLGVKLHDPKDPASALGPMFRQVCGTLFAQVEGHEPTWRVVGESEPVPTLGLDHLLEATPIAVDHHALVAGFQAGFAAHEALYRRLTTAPVFDVLVRAAGAAPDALEIPPHSWARLVYEMLAAYHHLDREHDRQALIPYLTPLYLGQVAAFVNQTQTLDAQAAEAVIETIAQGFEAEKPHLLCLWARRLEAQHGLVLAPQPAPL